ncbi:hypothetical protein H257_19227 [Aphanomyces astaci]|uniref:Tyr recombinase domain-containing protein n=1 Tax=Aphanomyces astaci TaxID=112090 RepID=W4FA87_APHAT|nr:hypothetical protein H257_19227 [Aphanomyces astaci]ETV63839.1 hypothetical protein H257_19227 [Aphanomyces astaci]|eukprot:XP_009846676.1 hypothetical protein H257_19227 [Aphanomyces astaci]
MAYKSYSIGSTLHTHGLSGVHLDLPSNSTPNTQFNCEVWTAPAQSVTPKILSPLLSCKPYTVGYTSPQATTNGKPTNHTICVRDITFLDRRDQRTRHYDSVFTVQFVSRTKFQNRPEGHKHKTPTRKIGTPLALPHRSSVGAASTAHNIGPYPADPLCCASRGKLIKCEEIALLIQTAAAAIGLGSSKYLTHSLRSGGATALFNGGATDLSIQFFGHWSSDTYKMYTRISGHEVAGMKTNMVSSAL